METESQARYAEYLKTDYWLKVSDAVKAKAGYRCQVCNSPHDLQAHHRSYAHRGKELEHLDDVTCLCRRCHEIFHGKKPEFSAPPVAAPEPELVLINSANCKRLRCHKPAWHWMKDNGIDPQRKGWAKRAIGHWVPSFYLRGG